MRSATVRRELMVMTRDSVLLQRIRAGDREALDLLIDAYQPIIDRLAGRLRGRGLCDLDLIAEGTVGLVRAARCCPISQECHFLPVAVCWIHRTIESAIDEQIAADAVKRPIGGDWV